MCVCVFPPSLNCLFYKGGAKVSIIQHHIAICSEKEHDLIDCWTDFSGKAVCLLFVSKEKIHSTSWALGFRCNV